MWYLWQAESQAFLGRSRDVWSDWQKVATPISSWEVGLQSFPDKRGNKARDPGPLAYSILLALPRVSKDYSGLVSAWINHYVLSVLPAVTLGLTGFLLPKGVC